MMKKFLILLLLCLLPVMAFAEVILVAENDRLELHYDTVESQIILKDKLTQEEKEIFHQCCDGIRHNMEHLKEI